MANRFCFVYSSKKAILKKNHLGVTPIFDFSIQLSREHMTECHCSHRQAVFYRGLLLRSGTFPERTFDKRSGKSPILFFYVFRVFGGFSLFEKFPNGLGGHYTFFSTKKGDKMMQYLPMHRF